MTRDTSALPDREIGRLVLLFAALVTGIVAMALLASWQAVAQASDAAEARNRLAVSGAIDREMADLARTAGASRANRRVSRV